ncbi:MAG: GNAT family N-acetyltransferase [bacterium]
MIKFNTYKYQIPSKNPVAFSGKLDSAEKMVKDIKLSNLYGTSDLGKVKINGKTFDVQSVGENYFSINDKKKQLGFIITSNREYNGKTCCSVAELRNMSEENGIGTKLMQMAYKAHKDSGKTGEFRAHEVLLEAEEFYEKLGLVEDTKRAAQWYLPFENEHILEQKYGGL